jgi:hypothetical protein
VASDEGTRGGTARREEREERDGLFAARDDRSLDSDDDFIRQQDPERLEQDAVERTDARQERRQHDDGDAETGDGPIGPDHVPAAF